MEYCKMLATKANKAASRVFVNGADNPFLRLEIRLGILIIIILFADQWEMDLFAKEK
jgi:hypothetical protein